MLISKNGITFKTNEISTIYFEKYNLYPIKIFKSNDYWLPYNYSNLIKLSKIKNELSKIIENYFDTITINKNIELSNSIINNKLRDYQKEDLRKMLYFDGFANFSEQRTGKTITTLAYINELKDKCNKWIIIAPLSVLGITWLKDIPEWLPDLKVFNCLNLKLKKRKELINSFINEQNQSVLLITIGTLRNITDQEKSITKLKLFDQYLLNFGLVIDECSWLKNQNTKQVKLIKKIKKFAKYRIALTGTPYTKNIFDIYGIMNFIQPSIFKSKWNIASYFFEISIFKEILNNFRNNNQNLKFEWLEWIETFTTRHLQKDVLKFLPKVERTIINIEMNNNQSKRFDLMLKQFKGYTQNNDLILAKNLLDQFHKLSQINLDINGTKIEWIIDYLNNHSENILIVSNSTNYCLIPLFKELQKLKFNNLEIITGNIPIYDRINIIDKINSRNKNILLANIKCISTGIKLTKIDTLIYLDKSLSFEQNEQLESRFLPTNNEEKLSSKLIIELKYNNFVDNTIDRLLKEKISLQEYLKIYQNN